METFWEMQEITKQPMDFHVEDAVCRHTAIILHDTQQLVNHYFLKNILNCCYNKPIYIKYKVQN